MSAPHTPGPWRWEVNRKHKTVNLCGGPPKHGFGRYNLTVLSFRRYGMNGAAPVFWNWNMERWVSKPQRADELASEVEGREHHADWFAEVNHPDARLIAAAPELLEALIQSRAVLVTVLAEETRETAKLVLQRRIEAASAAISKARGGAA